MSDVQSLATQFTTFYYDTFDNNRTGLRDLYVGDGECSMLTYQHEQVLGVQNILEKLVNLPLQRVKHNVQSLDVQPARADGSVVLVLVSGLLAVDEEDHPLKFTQTFQLLPENGSWYVYNDIFQLV